MQIERHCAQHISISFGCVQSKLVRGNVNNAHVIFMLKFCLKIYKWHAISKHFASIKYTYHMAISKGNFIVVNKHFLNCLTRKLYAVPTHSLPPYQLKYAVHILNNM